MSIQALSLSNTCAKVNASRATIYRWLDRGEFPQPIRMGRRIKFIESEVDAWLDAKIAERDAGLPK